MKVDMNAVVAWTKQADLIFQTPLMRGMLLPLLKLALPSLGVTPAQIAVLDAHDDDYTARLAEARRRAGQDGDAT
jgi:hypothetical protein